MSIRLMSAAWELEIPSTEKMVLMCLCDYADDQGNNCWPAVATLARKCSKSDRTVRTALASLETMGFLIRKSRSGTSNSFALDPCKICTPAKSAPLRKTTKTPAKSAPNPPRTTNTIKKAIPADWWPEQFGADTESRPIVDSWSEKELRRQVEQFKANHDAKGNTFKNPQSAWSTWVLNSEKFKPRKPPAQRGGSLADIGDEVREMYGY